MASDLPFPYKLVFFGKKSHWASEGLFTEYIDLPTQPEGESEPIINITTRSRFYQKNILRIVNYTRKLNAEIDGNSLFLSDGYRWYPKLLYAIEGDNRQFSVLYAIEKVKPTWTHLANNEEIETLVGSGIGTSFVSVKEEEKA